MTYADNFPLQFAILVAIAIVAWLITRPLDRIVTTGKTGRVVARVVATVAILAVASWVLTVTGHPL